MTRRSLVASLSFSLADQTPPLAGCAESSTTLGAEDPTVPDKNSPRPFVGGNQGRSRIRAPGESPDAIEKLGNELQ